MTEELCGPHCAVQKAGGFLATALRSVFCAFCMEKFSSTRGQRALDIDTWGGGCGSAGEGPNCSYLQVANRRKGSLGTTQAGCLGSGPPPSFHRQPQDGFRAECRTQGWSCRVLVCSLALSPAACAWIPGCLWISICPRDTNDPLSGHQVSKAGGSCVCKEQAAELPTSRPSWLPEATCPGILTITPRKRNKFKLAWETPHH